MNFIHDDNFIMKLKLRHFTCTKIKLNNLHNLCEKGKFLKKS